MNPNRGESSQANFELPPQPPSPEANGQPAERAAEGLPARPEQAGKQANQPALPAVPDDIPTADEPAIPGVNDEPQDSFDPHQAAQESDHIEREWVDKTKTVISQTRDDPFAQKREMSKLKADYIQKRFNKHVKTDEAAA